MFFRINAECTNRIVTLFTVMFTYLFGMFSTLRNRSSIFEWYHNVFFIFIIEMLPLTVLKEIYVTNESVKGGGWGLTEMTP